MFKIFLLSYMVTSIICLISGLFAILSKKKQGNHTIFGEIYHWSYFIVFVAAVDMTIMNWEKSQSLFYIVLFSYGFALLAYMAGINKWKNWFNFHRGGMLISYVGLVADMLVAVTF